MKRFLFVCAVFIHFSFSPVLGSSFLKRFTIDHLLYSTAGIGITASAILFYRALQEGRLMSQEQSKLQKDYNKLQKKYTELNIENIVKKNTIEAIKKENINGMNLELIDVYVRKKRGLLTRIG